MWEQSLRLSYPQNVRFACSKCGLCCGDTAQKKRHILLLETDVQQIAAHSRQPVNLFAAKTDGKEPYIYEMHKSTETGKCIFLQNNQCTVYEARPLICRFYPFELTTAENGEPCFRVTFECPGVASPDTPKRGGKTLGESHFRSLLRLAYDRHKQPTCSRE